jgi:hypothetical protein
MIELLNSNELKLTLDPVSTQERVLSIAFDIKAEMNFPYQNVQIEIKSCWIEHSALNDFEGQVRDFTKGERSIAILQNMSNQPIFRIIREKTNIQFLIEASDSVGMGKGTIAVNGYEAEVKELLERLRDYPKWW